MFSLFQFCPANSHPAHPHKDSKINPFYILIQTRSIPPITYSPPSGAEGYLSFAEAIRKMWCAVFRDVVGHIWIPLPFQLGFLNGKWFCRCIFNPSALRMENEIVLSPILAISLQIKAFSLCAERGSAERMRVAWVLRDGICFSERNPLPQIRWIILDSAFYFPSLFPHSVSPCIKCLVLGMTDVKSLMSWLQGVDLHCIFCRCDAGRKLAWPSLWYLLTPFPPDPCGGCVGQGHPPITKLWLFSCLAALSADSLKCPTKLISLHFSQQTQL